VDTTASIISKKLTYSAGTWSIGSDVSVYTSTICTSQSEGDSMYKPILRVTPTGLALAFFQQYEISCQNSGTDFLNFATADFNLNWGVSNAGSFDVDAIGVSNVISNLVVDGNVIWFYLGTDLYYTTDGTVYNKVPNTNISGSIAGDPMMCYGLDQLNIVYDDSSTGLMYRSYNITTGALSSATTISSVINDALGTVVCDSYNIWAVYQSYVASNSYNVVYKRFNGSVWDSSATSITTDNLNNGNINSPARALDSSVVPILWRVGTASPYTIKATTLSALGSATDTGNQTGSLTGILTGSSGDTIVKCGVWYYDTVNIVAGMTIKVCPSNGASGGSLEIHANSVTVAGTVDGTARGLPGAVSVGVAASGMGGYGGSSGTNGSIGSAGSAGTNSTFNGTYNTGGGGGGGGGAGQIGGTGNNGGYNAAASNGDTSTDETLVVTSSGGTGGTGGQGGTGGVGGLGTTTPGGSGGGGGTGGAGGKGGNAGAIIKIYSVGNIVVTGLIANNGQTGGSGFSGGRGTDGAMDTSCPIC
jgi:hypothetical protein